MRKKLAVALVPLAAALTLAGCGGGATFKAGDRVEVTPSVLHGYDIKKTESSGTHNGIDYTVQEAHDGTSFTCSGGLMTFADKTTNKTYCLSVF
jgi:hypothetical protein